MRRFYSGFACALLLAACSPSAVPPSGQASSTEVSAAVKPNLPKWLLIARTGGDGGGIYVDPDSRQAGPSAGLFDVTVKVVRGDPRVIDPTAADVGLYREELTTFRFNCPAQTYLILKREALNQLGQVIDTTVPKGDPAVVPEAAYLPIQPGGVAGVALGQACPPAR